MPIDIEFSRANKRALVLPAELAADVEIEYWDAHANRELALLHRPTRTLVEADVLFNLPAREQYSRTGEDPAAGAWTRFALHFTTEGKGQQRFMW